MFKFYPCFLCLLLGCQVPTAQRNSNQIPAVTIPPKPGVSQTFYFAVTADLASKDSDYSNEVSYGRTNAETRTVKLGWDYTNDAAYTFMVFRGRQAGVYTNSYAVGTNRTAIIPLTNAITATNIVVSVTTTGATNLLSANLLEGPWIRLNRTNYVGTNIHSPTYFRGVGRRVGVTTSIATTRQ